MAKTHTPQNVKYPKLMSQTLQLSTGVTVFIEVTPKSEKYPVTPSVALQGFFLKKTAQGINRTWIRLSHDDVQGLIDSLKEVQSHL